MRLGIRESVSLLIAQAHESSGNVAEARKRIETMLLSQPHDLRLLEEAVRLSSLSKRSGSAVTYQQRLTEIAGTPENHAKLIQLKVAAGQLTPNQAFALQMQSVTDAKVLSGIARGAIDKNDHEKVIIVCRKLLAQNPAYWDAQFYLARAIVLQARTKGVISAEGLAMCQRLVDWQLPLKTPPPLFAAANPAPTPIAWGSSLNLLLFNSPRISRSRQSFFIGLDSLAHAQTLTAPSSCSPKHIGASPMTKNPKRSQHVGSRTFPYLRKVWNTRSCFSGDNW